MCQTIAVSSSRLILVSVVYHAYIEIIIGASCFKNMWVSNSIAHILADFPDWILSGNKCVDSMLSGRQKQPVRCCRVDWLRKKCIPCTKNQEPLVQDPDARANVSVGHGKAFEVIHISNSPTRSCSMYKGFHRIRVLTSEFKGNLFNKSELLWLFSHEMLIERKKFLRSALRSYVFVHLQRSP